MARTVRTGAEQRASSHPPAAGGNVQNGTSSGSPSSVTVVASKSMSHPVTEACPTRRDSASDRSEADYLRARTTVPRMHPRTGDGDVGRPEDAGSHRPRHQDRRPGRAQSHHRHHSSHQGHATGNNFHGSAGHGRGCQHHSGKGGQRYSYSWMASYDPRRDQRDRYYDGDRYYDSDRYDNDRGWRRDRGMGREDCDRHDRQYGRPSRGDYSREREGPGREEYRSHKRRKDGCGHGYDNSTRHGGAPRSWHCAKPAFQGREEQRRSTEQVDELRRQVVSLQKDINDMKDAHAPTSGGKAGRNGALAEHAPSVGEVQRPATRAPREARAAAPTAGRTTRSVQSDLAPQIGNASRVVAHTALAPSPALTRVANSANGTDQAIKREAVDESELCYDASTDEEVSFKEDAVHKTERNAPSDHADDTHHRAPEVDAKEGGYGADSADQWENAAGDFESVDKDDTRNKAKGNVPSNPVNDTSSHSPNAYTNDGDYEADSDQGEEIAGDANDNSLHSEDSASEEESHDEDSVDQVLRDDYRFPQGNIAFCCQNCRCWDTKFPKYSGIRNNCGNSGDRGFGNTELWHKGCCHSDKTTHEDYLSPMTRAMGETFDPTKKKQQPAFRLDSRHEIKKAYNNAKREESRFENEESEEARDNSIYSNPIFESCSKAFSQRQRTRTKPLRVLDLFSGIGSGVVVLKRLRVPIQTIVHVEHDPVAVEVCKRNHKGDGIEHVYIEAFEDVYGEEDEPKNYKIEALLDKHGPFDLVLAGAPCSNYSGLNASRDGTSENAQYLLKVGRLIQKLDDIQMNSRNVEHNVLFLSENVVFKDHEKADRSYLGGMPPIRMDAKDFSPCKRSRFYWINLPVSSADTIKLVASTKSIDGLLDEGYGAVARLIEGEDESTLTVKSNTFLASLGRIDDNRMIRYKKDKSSSPSAKAKYKIETYSVGEREKMMGLPAGYVEKPVKKLFDDLAQKAFVMPETSAEGKSYRDFLPQRLWHFRRKCQFKFRPSPGPTPEPPYFQLALSSPREGKLQFAFYEEKQYCKHLVGNGWSIPVVEYLLGRLPDLFPEHVLREYDGYNNPHPWEPYMSL